MMRHNNLVVQQRWGARRCDGCRCALPSGGAVLAITGLEETTLGAGWLPCKDEWRRSHMFWVQPRNLQLAGEPWELRERFSRMCGSEVWQAPSFCTVPHEKGGWLLTRARSGGGSYR